MIVKNLLCIFDRRLFIPNLYGGVSVQMELNCHLSPKDFTLPAPLISVLTTGEP